MQPLGFVRHNLWALPLFVLTASLLLCGCVRTSPTPANATQSKTVSKPSGSEIRQRVQRAIAEEGHSLQLVLRRMKLDVLPLLDGQLWADIEALLPSDGLVFLRSRKDQYAMTYYYGVLEKVKFAWAGDFGFSVEIEIGVWDLRGAQDYGKVILVDPKLVLSGPIPWDQLLREKCFPEGSFGSKALLHRDVSEATLKYPVVKRLELEYVETGPGLSDPAFWCFRAVVELQRQNNPDYCKSIFLSAASNLDPLPTELSSPDSPPFVPSDSFGELWYGGGVESWPSER